MPRKAELATLSNDPDLPGGAAVARQKAFAALIAGGVKDTLVERRMTYADLAHGLAEQGLVTRKKKPYTAKAIERALRTGGIPAYLLAAICVILKVRAIPMRKL